MQMNPSKATPPMMALPSSYTALTTLGLGIRQLGVAPKAQSPIKLFKLDHPLFTLRLAHSLQREPQ